MKLLVLVALLTGCIERQEIREQHCAHLAIDRHGWHRPRGVYSTQVRGDRCYARLYDGMIAREGRLDDKWRPE